MAFLPLLQQNGYSSEACGCSEGDGANRLTRTGDSGQSQVFGRPESAHHEECEGTCQGRRHPYPARIWKRSQEVALRCSPSTRDFSIWSFSLFWCGYLYDYIVSGFVLSCSVGLSQDEADIFAKKDIFMLSIADWVFSRPWLSLWVMTNFPAVHIILFAVTNQSVFLWRSGQIDNSKHRLLDQFLLVCNPSWYGQVTEI